MDTPLTLPRSLLIDMDGTLTEPMLDFPRIKAEMGIGNRPILEALRSMPDAERRAAEQVLHRYEEHAADNSSLNPGCRELLHWLDRQNMGVALVTRNTLSSVRTVMTRHDLRIDVLITRDDGVFKPDPAPLKIALQRLNVAASDAWMVGDGQYDIEAGIAAGVPTVWVSHGERRPFKAEPAHTVPDLIRLLQLLKSLQTSAD